MYLLLLTVSTQYLCCGHYSHFWDDRYKRVSHDEVYILLTSFVHQLTN